MKFCLRNRQIGEYLQKADEIKMEYRDYKSIPDLFEKYPDKPIIVQIPYHITADWDELELYKRMKPDNLICCISSMEDAEICKDLGIKFNLLKFLFMWKIYLKYVKIYICIFNI